ncbi:MAG: GmrSD restriction endonuclease domain-containing protein, partial [Ktedonobacterales bacterium]
PVTYLVKNFNNQNLDKIRQNWPGIKQAMRAGIDLVNSFGIDRDTLTSANALIPVMYFLYRHPQAAPQHGSSLADAENALLMRRWLLMALLNNVFTGQSDSTLNTTRRVLQEHAESPIFPASAISAELAKTGRLTQFNDQASANFLDISYGLREAFLALSLLYDDNSWGTMAYHQDHIFPQSLFDWRKMDEAGISGMAKTRYRMQMNSIANLELLSGSENLEKSNQDFGYWLTSRNVNFKQRHLIPDDPTPLRFDRFEDFVAAREALIRDRLQSLFAPMPTRIEEAQ